MTFVDTGYFLALFNPRDPLHARAVAWSEHLKGRFVVTEHVLWECVNAFSKPDNRSTAQALAEYIQSERGGELIYASRELLVAGMSLHRQRLDKEWSLTDCISFHVMGQRRLTEALAHDLHFEQAGFDALLRRDPSDIRS